MTTPIDKVPGEGKLDLSVLNRRKPFRLVTTNPTDRTNPDVGFLATWIRSIRAIRGRDLPRYG